MERTASGSRLCRARAMVGERGLSEFWLSYSAPNLMTARWAGLGECIMQALLWDCAWWIGGPPWDGFSTPGGMQCDQCDDGDGGWGWVRVRVMGEGHLRLMSMPCRRPWSAGT